MQLCLHQALNLGGVQRLFEGQFCAEAMIVISALDRGAVGDQRGKSVGRRARRLQRKGQERKEQP